jgi:hypothetical protein
MPEHLSLFECVIDPISWTFVRLDGALLTDGFDVPTTIMLNERFFLFPVASLAGSALCFVAPYVLLNRTLNFSALKQHHVPGIYPT